jgi:hypothetical protein
VTPAPFLFGDASGERRMPPTSAREPRAFNDSTDRSSIENISWLTLVSGVERGATLVQVVIIARAIGITDNGVSVLIFGTVGLAASMTAMQMGFTATVFVARYRKRNRRKPPSSFRSSLDSAWRSRSCFCWCRYRSRNLLPTGYCKTPALGQPAVIAGCLLVAVSIVSVSE